MKPSAHYARVAEDELQAYVDGLLSPEDRGRVEAYLSAFPEERERLESYRRQNVHMHRLFDWYMRRPDDEAVTSLAHRYARLERRHARLRTTLRVAALLAVIAVSTSFGWMGSSWFGVGDEGRSAMIRQAAEAHFLAASKVGANTRMSSAESEGTGVSGLLHWMASNYKAMPRKVPDYSSAGFELVGGRVFPTGYGPAVQFLYTDGVNRRVTLFIGPARTESETRRVTIGDDRLAMLHGQKLGLAYSLIGNVSVETLSDMADVASAMVEAPPPDRLDSRAPQRNDTVPAQAPVQSEGQSPGDKAPPARQEKIMEQEPKPVDETMDSEKT